MSGGWVGLRLLAADGVDVGVLFGALDVAHGAARRAGRAARVGVRGAAPCQHRASGAVPRLSTLASRDRNERWPGATPQRAARMHTHTHNLTQATISTPYFSLSHFSAMAPAATRPIVSRALARPPPLAALRV